MTRYQRYLGMLAVCALSGCLLQHDRCGAHQVELHGDFASCVCEPNAVFDSDGTGCVPCGAHAVVQNGACVCEEGFTKVSDAEGCALSGVGAACSASKPCGTDFPYCVMASASEGYCTRSGCASNAECPASYTCETSGSTRYCRKAPTGLGTPCTANADCASYEASYCETFSTHTCILQGCASGAVTCPNEWACCDYSGLLGAPFSTCASPSQQTAGACPSGGTRVSP